MNKLYSVLMVGALMGTLVGCGANDGNNARTNQYQGYQMGANNNGFDMNNTRSQTTRNNGSTTITNTTDDNTDTAEEYKGYFKDVAKGQWFTDNVEWAKDTGMMGGYPGGNFQPNKPITRAEITAILANLAERGYIDVPEQADETPVTEPPATETPATETPATETPATETPATETPAAETPATETPATETPAAETPATETPAAETPAPVGATE